MNRYEVPAFLEGEMPGIKSALKVIPITKESCDPEKLVKSFFSFTAQCVEHHNFSAARKCFHSAEKLVLKGDKTIRNAMYHIYIPAMSSLFKYCQTKRDRYFLQESLPWYLYCSYERQRSKDAETTREMSR